MFKIIGADGKEYGPISAEVLQKWIGEGRANAQSKVRYENSTEWRTVAEFPELVAAMPGIVPPLPPVQGSAIEANSAANQVNGPGIALIVTGACYVLLALFRFVSTALGLGLNAAFAQGNPEMQKFMAMVGPINISLGVLTLLFGGLVLWGGIKMRKLQSYGLSLTAAIIALLPCTFPCCFIGLPIGVWALVILAKPEVKSQFS